MSKTYGETVMDAAVGIRNARPDFWRLQDPKERGEAFCAYYGQFPEYEKNDETDRFIKTVFSPSEKSSALAAYRPGKFVLASRKKNADKAKAVPLEALIDLENDPLGKRFGAAYRWCNAEINLITYKNRSAEDLKCANCEIFLRDKNAFAITGAAVKIDYRANPAYENLSPEAFFRLLMAEADGLMPVPTFCLGGVTLTLVYMLKTPAALAAGKNEARGNIDQIKMFESQVAKIVRQTMLVEAQGATKNHHEGSWVLMPGTTEVDFCDKNTLTMERQATVRAFAYQDPECGSYTFSELCSEAVPKVCSGKKKKKKSRRPKMRMSVKILQARLDDFSRLILMKHPCTKSPYVLMWLIADTLSWLYPFGSRHFKRELKKYNDLMEYPLDMAFLMDKFDSLKNKNYMYKNITIMNMLGLTDEWCAANNFYLHIDVNTAAYLKREEEGRTQEMRRQSREFLIRPLIDEGYSTTEIYRMIDGYYGKTTIKKEAAKYRAEKAAKEKNPTPAQKALAEKWRAQKKEKEEKEERKKKDHEARILIKYQKETEEAAERFKNLPDSGDEQQDLHEYKMIVYDNTIGERERHTAAIKKHEEKRQEDLRKKVRRTYLDLSKDEKKSNKKKAEEYRQMADEIISDAKEMAEMKAEEARGTIGRRMEIREKQQELRRVRETLRAEKAREDGRDPKEAVRRMRWDLKYETFAGCEMAAG